MVNSELSEISYVIQAGVTTYPIGFEYHFNENNSPQLLVKIGESVAIINVDFQLSADESEIILIPTEEEAKAQISPNDTRWMERIVGKELLITRDIPFVQTSDYSVGRINPEQIEYDFDRAVMRDQEILHQLSDFTVDIALAESLANAAVETANEAATAANQATATANTALDTANTAVVTANEAKTTAIQASQDAVDAMADAASAVNKADAADMTATTAMEIAAEATTIAQGAGAAVANKQDKLVAGQGITIDGNTISATDGYSKTEIDNKISVIEADIDANADAIQKTRADFIAADSDIHTILNNHASELTTLHNDVDEVGDQVSGIEEKIPGTASASNPLITKQQLLDEEMDIREDLNSGLSELQTQITAQATAIAGKQDKLSAGYGITINESTNTISAEFPTHVSSINGYDGNILLEPGDGIKFENTTGTLGSGWKISATASGGGGGITKEEADATYLPISGGRITGELTFGTEEPFISPALFSNSTGTLKLYDRETKTVGLSFSLYGISCNIADTSCLGDEYNPWGQVFTKKLNAGSGDLIVPTEGGTLARMEDIDAIGGDGTAGQVLTKTDDGMAWQDSTGGGASLPDQTDNAGKFLMTDGETTSWGSALVNRATRTGSLILSDSKVVNASGAVSIGYSHDNTTTGSTFVGYNIINSLGFYNTLIGHSAGTANSYATAVGYYAYATQGSVAIGSKARALANNSAIISTGRITERENAVADTFAFGNSVGVYEVVSADGTIPAARHAALPAADGTYVLKLSIVDGVPTLGWAAE